MQLSERPVRETVTSALGGRRCVTHLFEHVQDELLVDLADAHGERLAVHALTEVTRAHQADDLPGVQTLLLRVQLQPVVLEALLHPAAPHRLRQLTQEVLYGKLIFNITKALYSLINCTSVFIFLLATKHINDAQPGEKVTSLIIILAFPSIKMGLNLEKDPRYK